MPATSITAKSGADFLIKAADPDVSPSVYATIGGTRNSTMTFNNNPIDITNISSNSFREWFAKGIQQVDISGDGIFDSATTGAQNLEKAARTRVLTDIQVSSGHGDSFIFSAVVNTFERSGNVDGVEEFSFSLSSHGSIHHTPSA